MPVLRLPDLPDLHYVRTGARGAPPVVMLHALGLDLGVWSPQFEAWGGERDLIALDLPGHGASGALDAAPDFARLAAIVAAAIAALCDGPVHLVGISVGGMIAQRVAVMQPGLLRSLVLVATSCTFPEPVRERLRERARRVREAGMAGIVPQHLERWFPAQFRRARPDLLDRFAKILMRQAPEFHARMWDMVATLDVAPRLSALTCPVLVVAGEDDPSASPAAGQAIVERIAGAQLATLPGCGHFPQLERPAEFDRLLGAFLSRAERQ